MWLASPAVLGGAGGLIIWSFCWVGFWTSAPKSCPECTTEQSMWNYYLDLCFGMNAFMECVYKAKPLKTGIISFFLSKYL